MITWKESIFIGDGTYYREGTCLSSDTPPTTGIANGSKLEVINVTEQSMTIEVFDQGGGAWVPVAKVSMPAGS